MSSQTTFSTPRKKDRPATKLRSTATPTTFSLITKNLMKNFAAEADPLTVPVLDNIAYPDFSKVTFPDEFSAAERKRLIGQMTVHFAATVASESVRPKTPKFSFKDIETQHANDVKPIDEPIKDSAESFLTGLFQFRRIREQSRGWESVTFFEKLEATDRTARDDDDDDDTHDANKWTPSRIDLFKDFERIDLESLRKWALAVWESPNATLESQDGQSPTYARKVLSEFIFASLVPDLQKAIQNAITQPRLWNDGPYVWATLVHRFFPSAVVLRTTILDKMKSATLAEHNNDLSTYCAMLLDMNAVVDTSSHLEELVNAFLSQTNLHPSDIVRNHFNDIGLKFFLKTGKYKSFPDILAKADRIHTLTTSTALPFAASTANSSKHEQNIAAMAGILKSQTGSMRKMVAAISQLDNKVKQGFTKKDGTNGPRNKWQRRDTSSLPKPPWFTDAPSDTSEVKEFNGTPWFWCATCTRWSTSHSTNGMTHNGKQISKHVGYGDRNKKRNEQSPNTSSGAKKSKPNTPVNGLQSLKAELTKQNNSSVLDLIVRNAAGEQ